jgi:hypothetical protein
LEPSGKPKKKEPEVATVKKTMKKAIKKTAPKKAAGPVPSPAPGPVAPPAPAEVTPHIQEFLDNFISGPEVTKNIREERRKRRNNQYKERQREVYKEEYVDFAKKRIKGRPTTEI